MDLLFPEFLSGARCLWRIWRCVSIPTFQAHLEQTFSDQNLEMHDPIVWTPPIQQLILSHHLLFDFLFGFTYSFNMSEAAFIATNTTFFQICSPDTREDAKTYMTDNYIFDINMEFDFSCQKFSSLSPFSPSVGVAFEWDAGRRRSSFSSLTTTSLSRSQYKVMTETTGVSFGTLSLVLSTENTLPLSS